MRRREQQQRPEVMARAIPRDGESLGLVLFTAPPGPQSESEASVDRSVGNGCQQQSSDVGGERSRKLTKDEEQSREQSRRGHADDGEAHDFASNDRSASGSISGRARI